MNILLACPTRGHVWYETAMGLAELAEDPSISDFLYIQNNRSVIEARNEAIAAFLESPHDVLLMVDDDVIPPPGLERLAIELHSIEGAGIVGAPCPILLPGLPVLPNIYSIDAETKHFAIDMKASLEPSPEMTREVGAIGFGAVAISRSLAKVQPTFENRYDEDGKIYMGEDIDYCVRARQVGYSTFACLDLLCDHMLTIHGAGLARVFAGLLERELNV